MSRSGYIDDLGDDDPLAYGRWRGRLMSSIRGKNGQAFLREIIEALDALPEKRLVANSFAEPDGQNFCTLGAVGHKRGVDLAQFAEQIADDDLDQGSVAGVFGISYVLACEIMAENDDCGPHHETPEQRWSRMRRWAERHLIEWDK